MLIQLNKPVDGVILLNEPFSNLQITHAVKILQMPHSHDLYCRNELPQVVHRMMSEIINSDQVTGTGTHWIPWYQDGDTKYYFDSYSIQPPTELINYLLIYFFTYLPINYNSEQV